MLGGATARMFARALAPAEIAYLCGICAELRELGLCEFLEELEPDEEDEE